MALLLERSREFAVLRAMVAIRLHLDATLPSEQLVPADSPPPRARAGHDRREIGLLVFPNLAACRARAAAALTSAALPETSPTRRLIWAIWTRQPMVVLVSGRGRGGR